MHASMNTPCTANKQPRVKENKQPLYCMQYHTTLLAAGGGGCCPPPPLVLLRPIIGALLLFAGAGVTVPPSGDAPPVFVTPPLPTVPPPFVAPLPLVLDAGGVCAPPTPPAGGAAVPPANADMAPHTDEGRRAPPGGPAPPPEDVGAVGLRRAGGMTALDLGGGGAICIRVDGRAWLPRGGRTIMMVASTARPCC